MLSNSSVYTAIQVIAGELGSTPIKTDRQAWDRPLNVKPNGKQSRYNFIFSLVVDLIATGNAFAEIKDGYQLRYLSAESVQVKYDPLAEKVRYLYTVTDGAKTLTQTINEENILHFRIFTQGNIYNGISPLASLADELKVQKAGNKLLAETYSNPITGVVTLAGDINTDTAAQVTNKLKQAKQDVSNGQWLILQNGQEFKDLQIDSNLLQLVNNSDHIDRKIAASLGLPPEFLNIENNHSSVSQSLRIQYLNGLMPYFAAFESELQAKLGGTFKFVLTDILPESTTETAERIRSEIEAGLMTPNEGRQELGLDPLPDGDDLLTATNLTKLKNIDKQKGSSEFGNSND